MRESSEKEDEEKYASLRGRMTTAEGSYEENQSAFLNEKIGFLAMTYQF